MRGGKAHAKVGDRGWGGGQLPSFLVTCLCEPFSAQYLLREMLLPQCAYSGWEVNSGACPLWGKPEGSLCLLPPIFVTIILHMAKANPRKPQSCLFLAFPSGVFQSVLQTRELSWIFLVHCLLLLLARVQLLWLEIEELPASKIGESWGGIVLSGRHWQLPVFVPIRARGRLSLRSQCCCFQPMITLMMFWSVNQEHMLVFIFFTS